MFVVVATFLLIVAGALVTSNDAGLSVPDWPTSFGSLWKLPPMAGGVKYEHGHRMFAGFIGLMTIVLTAWAQKVETRRWVRGLAWGALGTVILQGVLGGVTVLSNLPWTVSTAHATLGQTFLCLVIAIAVVTGKTWIEGGDVVLEQGKKPDTATLTWLTAAAAWVQLILGAAFRHFGIKLLPHLIGACIVTALICWSVMRVLTLYGRVPRLQRPAALLLGLLMLQIGLGFVAYVTRLQFGHSAIQPAASMVFSTVAHVAGGALLLGTAVVLALQAHRLINAHPTESVSTSTQQMVVA